MYTLSARHQRLQNGSGDEQFSHLNVFIENCNDGDSPWMSHQLDNAMNPIEQSWAPLQKNLVWKRNSWVQCPACMSSSAPYNSSMSLLKTSHCNHSKAAKPIKLISYRRILGGVEYRAESMAIWEQYYDILVFWEGRLACVQMRDMLHNISKFDTYGPQCRMRMTFESLHQI